MSIFTPDTSIQLSGNSTNAITYNTRDNPNIAFHSRAGIYNSADNVIKIFTNNADALTINSSGQVICNGSLITDISWDNILGRPNYYQSSWFLVDYKPEVFPTNWTNVASKPSIFPSDWTNVASKPSIFPTNWDNVSSKPSNFQTDWNSTVLNRPDIFTKTETSNIFTTSNVIQNLQDFIPYSKLAGRPSLATVATSGLYNDLSGRPSLATVATSGLFNDLSGRPSVYPTDWTNVASKPSIFPTDWTNVSSKPTNFQSDWNSTIINKPTNFQTDWNTTVINRPEALTNISNIFTTSNVLSNTSNTLYNNVNLTNYFTKIETSNIFTTSNVASNTSNFLVNYNNLINKPIIGTGAGQFWTLDAPTNVIYNNNTNGAVVVNGTTINNGFRLKVNGNIFCDGSNIKLASSTSGDLMSIQFQDSATGYYSTAGCSIYKIPTHEFIIMNYTTSRLFFGVGGNIRGILDNGNNFSLGTAVAFPAARIHLNQTGAAELKILMTDGTTGHTGTDGCAIIKQSDNHMNIMNYEANDIIFSTNGVERMRIYGSGGNVNITNTLTGNLNATSGTITTLTSTTGNITTANITTDNISTANITTANITTDNITTANITTANITGNLKVPVNVAIRTNSDNVERFYFTGSGGNKYNSSSDHLFTIGGIPKLTITNSGSIFSDSLITFAPTGMFHLHKESAASDVVFRFSDSTYGGGATNGLVLWKDTNQDGRFWNYQNRALIFGTNNAERMRIKDNGYIGIGDTNCAGKLTIKSAFDNANDGIIINATDDGTANEKYMLKIYPYVVGGGQVGYRFRVVNSPTGNTTDAISIDHTGRTYFNNEVNMKVNLWNRSSEGQNRLYYMNGGRTYFGSGDGYTWESSGGAALAQLTNSGNFGLPYSGGTKLSVQSTTYTISSAYYAYFNATSGFNTNTYTYFTDVCAFFGSTIWVNGWIASSSDERIKKEIEDINDDYALQKILAIQPKTYKYRDEVSKGNKRVYGFIAQQIKEVLPEAVKDDNKEIIPNIYKFYNISNDIITTNEDLRDKLKVGDKIQYFLEKSKEMREIAIILEITDSYIKIDKSYDSNEKVFIYGSEVSDFHSVSKEYIFTLNVCATQELYRIIQQQQSIINDLKNRIEILENKN